MSYPPLQMSSLVSRNPDLLAVPMDGDIVMMSISQGMYYGINPVGARVWALLAQPQTVAALCQVIVAEFEVSAEQCQQDLLQFLQQMQQAEVVTVA